MAAGKGTRMNSDLPKVLHCLSGKPLIHHVVETAKRLGADRLIAVVGHRREDVQKALEGQGVEFVVQESQLGTGHAVQQAIPALRDFRGEVVVLSGDVPLLRASSLEQLVKYHRKTDAAATVLTAIAPDPFSYGRIVRDAEGKFAKIVEERDANERERSVREVNSGVYCFRAISLFGALQHLKNDNRKGEYYLTDVIGILRQSGEVVQAIDLAGFYEIRGINTAAELEEAESRWESESNSGNS
ncbi:MAG: NTP transferase domain-containing protein [bacterium]|nr:NTP transferase domain-containing protein [bacterium]